MTSPRPVRILLLALLSVAALVASGCGREDVVTEADTEGIWVDVGALDYHIQGSRVLEQGIVPDNAYLQGKPVTASDPKADELWFAVFLRIENKTDKPAKTARDFTIVDTQGKEFHPYNMDPNLNPFAYQPKTLEPNDAVPVPDSAQDFDSFAGAYLLFKLPLDSYANRPLEFVIHGQEGDQPAEASIALDV